MIQVTARLPDTLGAELDAAAQQLNRCGVADLKDPADPVLACAEVRDAQLAADACR